MGSEAIISKIIADAESSANGYAKDAKERSEEILSAAKSYSESYLKRAKAELDSDVELLKERKRTVATLDVRKILLEAKQSAITKCFTEARARVLAFSDEEYRAFIKGLLLKYGENGDKVVIGKAEKRIDKDFVSNFSKEAKIDIAMSEKTGNFDGGIILEHGGYDKNLTLDTLIRTLREEIEAEVAELLF